MALPTFNDGDPIDASVIQSLVTKISQLEAKIPTIGTVGTEINIDNKSADIVIPQIYGGISPKVTIAAETMKTFTINYSGAKLTSKPKSIILTPIHAENQGVHYQAHVISGSETATSARCQVYGGPKAAARTIQFYFMVIQHA
jgi:hypothetical protein